MRNEKTPDGYDPAFFRHLFDIEDKHFWFRTRNRVIVAWINRLTSELRKGFRILEIGCGTGNVLRVLDKACPNGRVFGLDLFMEGLKFAGKRTPSPLVQGDMHQPPFNAVFNILGLFDVLEHLPDDESVLNSLKEIIHTDGFLLITVPAHPRLWSYFDEASQHCRRYQIDELRNKLKNAGFDVIFITQYMMSLFPILLIGRHLSSIRRGVSKNGRDQSNTALVLRELEPIPILNEILSWLLGLEKRWLSCGRSLPIGTSILAVAKKRGN